MLHHATGIAAPYLSACRRPLSFPTAEHFSRDFSGCFSSFPFVARSLSVHCPFVVRCPCMSMSMHVHGHECTCSCPCMSMFLHFRQNHCRILTHELSTDVPPCYLYGGALPLRLSSSTIVPAGGANPRLNNISLMFCKQNLPGSHGIQRMSRAFHEHYFQKYLKVFRV